MLAFTITVDLFLIDAEGTIEHHPLVIGYVFNASNIKIIIEFYRLQVYSTFCLELHSWGFESKTASFIGLAYYTHNARFQFLVL